jgi:hypothetical protein
MSKRVPEVLLQHCRVEEFWSKNGLRNAQGSHNQDQDGVESEKPAQLEFRLDQRVAYKYQGNIEKIELVEAGLNIWITPNQMNNPAVIKTAADWRAFLHEGHIAYVVRARSYPATIAAPLEQLEKEGDLIPYSKPEVQDFQGMRIAGKREPVPVVILRVVPEASAPLRMEK